MFEGECMKAGFEFAQDCFLLRFLVLTICLEELSSPRV